MREQYENYIKEKRVAIVGPAFTIQGSSLGGEIDSFDVVVRFNNAFLGLKEEHEGSRTDVLYHSLHKPTYKIKSLCSISWIISAYPMIPPYLYDIVRFQNIYKQVNLPRKSKMSIVPEGTLQKITKRILSRPTTGLLAIQDVISCNPKEVKMFGVTMGIGGYKDTYHNGMTEEDNRILNSIHKNHSIDKQVIYLFNLMKESNIKSDKRSAELIDSHYNILKEGLSDK